MYYYIQHTHTYIYIYIYIYIYKLSTFNIDKFEYIMLTYIILYH